MTISTKSLKYSRRHWHAIVKIDQPEVAWEDGRFTFTQPNLSDNTPNRHDYQISITLDEFRRMLAAFSAAE